MGANLVDARAHPRVLRLRMRSRSLERGFGRRLRPSLSARKRDDRLHVPINLRERISVKRRPLHQLVLLLPLPSPLLPRGREAQAPSRQPGAVGDNSLVLEIRRKVDGTSQIGDIIDTPTLQREELAT